MQVRVLGPLEVVAADGPVEVGGARLRCLLVRLALDAGRPVGNAALAEAVWGADPPAELANALQSLVSRLRRSLRDPSLVVQVHGGYRLAVDPDDVDALRFERLIRDGDHARALELWRGSPFADLGVAPFVDEASHRLQALRVSALIEHASQGATVLGELASAAAANPLDERLAAAHLRALAAAGRPADALAGYESIRARLADELGVDPSAELQRVHLDLLRAPAAPVAASRRTNLPAGITSFVGREHEVARIGKLLEQHRLVTLAGPGGAGKTRLATEAATGLLQHVRDGVWFVGLASVTDGADVPHTVLGSLGLREVSVVERTTKLTAQDAMTRLVESLREESAVIVLDNCEHVIDAAARLADSLLASCSGLRILATSREPLGITGESLVVVPPLELPPGDALAARDALEYPAVRLFADRAASVDADFAVDDSTTPAVLEIVRRLDGLPLAIELAAARLRSMSVAEVARRLSDRFRLLTGGSRTALPRHRTLRAVVEWSWELLTPPERLLAERLAVFPGGATVDSAEAVCVGAGIEAEEVIDLLTSLVDKSLLVRQAARYRMLETIREYGTERLGERGELAGVRQAHAGHFAALVGQAGQWLRRSEQLEWIARLGGERDNILAALRWFVDEGHEQESLDMLGVLSWYWMLMGNNSEVVAWTSAVLAAGTGGDPDQRVLAEALQIMNSGGAFVLPGGDVEGWQVAVDDVCARLAAVDARRHPVALFLNGVLSLFTQADERAAEFIDRAVACDDSWVSAAALMVRANIAENVGDVESMRVDAETALTAFGRLGERWGQANSLQVLAVIATMDARLDDALDLYGQALSLIHEMGSHEDEGFLLMRMADLRMRKGDMDGARRGLQHAAHERTAFGFPLQEVFLTSLLADVARLTGDLTEARRLRDETVAQLAMIPLVHPMRGHGLAITVGILARMELLDGDVDAARRHLIEAYVAGIATRDQPIMASVGIVTADLAVYLDQPVTAARQLGACARLRGGPDGTNLEIRRLTALLVERLGTDEFEAAYASGTGLDVEAALHCLDPALL